MNKTVILLIGILVGISLGISLDRWLVQGGLPQIFTDYKSMGYGEGYANCINQYNIKLK